MVWVAITLTATSFALYVTMMALFFRAIVQRRAPVTRNSAWAPRVSILKPLAGSDDDLAENLESFARLDYPAFEILLGVANRNDPAVANARRFAASHPELGVRLVLTDPNATINPKVAQLVGLEHEAAGDVCVISDSNVRVNPGYLWSMVNELEDPRVGVVTSLFSGSGERSLGAALENLQICASTAPGIAAMNAASRCSFTVGKSMALRRGDLERLGGFGIVGDVLAEDHILGRRFMAAGFTTRLSREIVENRNVVGSVRKTLERHTRWAKTRRSLMPRAFPVEPLLTPIVVATFGLLFAPSKEVLAVLGAVALAQTALALVAVRLIRGTWLAWWYAPLEVVRSYASVVCWFSACLSHRIVWRGHAFVLLRGSAIVPSGATTHSTERSRARYAA
jgi:ceramide glucosyltransferase